MSTEPNGIEMNSNAINIESNTINMKSTQNQDEIASQLACLQNVCDALSKQECENSKKEKYAIKQKERSIKSHKDLSPLETRILLIFNKQHKVTIKQFISQLPVQHTCAAKHIRRLVNNGLVLKCGKGKETWYELVE